jgi:hypothetical protein
LLPSVSNTGFTVSALRHTVIESMHLIRSAERDARRRHFTDICHCELNEINSGGSANAYILLSLSELEIFAEKARPSAPAAENFPLKRH